MKNLTPSLNSLEWFVSLSILLILFFFVLIAKIQSFRVGNSLSPASEVVEVTLVGHVAKPGCFKVERGTPLSELLTKAKPLSFADLSFLSASPRVVENCSYTIEKMTELSVIVEGACQRVELKVLPGSRICDLKRLISPHSNADLTVFNKKRCVKNKEIIKITLKKVAKKEA